MPSSSRRRCGGRAGCPVSANYSLMPGYFGRLRHVVGAREARRRVRRAAATVQACAGNGRFRRCRDRHRTTRPPSPGRPSRMPTCSQQGHAGGRPCDSSQRPGRARRLHADLRVDEPAEGRYADPAHDRRERRRRRRRVLGNARPAGATSCSTGCPGATSPAPATSWPRCAAAAASTSTAAGRCRALFEESLRNLKEIPPTFHINVPFGYAMLVDALEKDAELRQRFFAQPAPRVIRRRGSAAGALRSLPAARRRHHRRTASSSRPAMAPPRRPSGCMAIYFPTEEVGIGLPMPGLTLKLVRDGPRYEVRVRRARSSRQATRPTSKPIAIIFDYEGCYRTGRRPPSSTTRGHRQGPEVRRPPVRGLRPRHRHLGRCGSPAHRVPRGLRAAAPRVLVCGENRAQGGGCSPGRARLRPRRPAPTNPPRACNLQSRPRRERTRRTAVAPLRAAERRPARVSDKGLINQRVVITRRAAEVERLYAAAPDPAVILPAAQLARPSHTEFPVRSVPWRSRAASH